MSASTADRILYRIRHSGTPRPSKRAPSSPMLKKLIPVRTFDDLTENRPGYLEGDFVWHCGAYAGGSFVNSFVLTDVETGWTECFALLYKDADSVIKAFKQARALFPFEIRGLDTDNGPEFITYKLYEYCQNERITFTRSRPWKKNDQCFVEQKNGLAIPDRQSFAASSVMNALRVRTPARVLTELYQVIRLYVNFFQPSMRLLSKSRMGAKTFRLYDEPRTPYDWILGSDRILA